MKKLFSWCLVNLQNNPLHCMTNSQIVCACRTGFSLTFDYVLSDPSSMPSLSYLGMKSVGQYPWHSLPQMKSLSRRAIRTSVQSTIGDTVHRLIPNPGGLKRTCAYCKQEGTKFKCGMFRRSYYRCEACDVALCRPRAKDCFEKWHLLHTI